MPPDAPGHVLTRRTFGAVALAALTAGVAPADQGPRVLVVVAHPDDEYHFAVTIFRIVRDLGGTVDQVVVTNGEGGYRYSALAEIFYGDHLTDEAVGRAKLPEIRKQETLAAGRILGIRQHYFLDQHDGGYTLDPEESLASWDRQAIRIALDRLLASGSYDFVFTLVPSADTHGHHKAVALLALEAVESLAPESQPAVLAAEAVSGSAKRPVFKELPGYPLTRVTDDVMAVSRSQPFGFHNALNYQIVANWVIAEHKSQGLFQMDASRHDEELFWRFSGGSERSREKTAKLFSTLRSR